MLRDLPKQSGSSRLLKVVDVVVHGDDIEGLSHRAGPNVLDFNRSALRNAPSLQVSPCQFRDLGLKLDSMHPNFGVALEHVAQIGSTAAANLKHMYRACRRNRSPDRLMNERLKQSRRSRNDLSVLILER